MQNEEEIYEIQRIVKRKKALDGKIYCKIKWKGLSEDKATWELQQTLCLPDKNKDIKIKSQNINNHQKNVQNQDIFQILKRQFFQGDQKNNLQKKMNILNKKINMINTVDKDTQTLTSPIQEYIVKGKNFEKGAIFLTNRGTIIKKVDLSNANLIINYFQKCLQNSK